MPNGARSACLNISYHIDEPIRGDISERISISECVNDVSVENMKQDSANLEEYYGMKVGAYVFLAATREGSPSQNLRLLKPNCWGFWHHRVGKYKAKFRREFIERQREMFVDQ